MTLRIPRLIDIQKANAEIRYAKLEDVPHGVRVNVESKSDTISGVLVDSEPTNQTSSVVVATGTWDSSVATVVSTEQPAQVEPIRSDSGSAKNVNTIEQRSLQRTSEVEPIRSDSGSAKNVNTIEQRSLQRTSEVEPIRSDSGSVKNVDSVKQNNSQIAMMNVYSVPELGTIQEFTGIQVSAAEHVREIAAVRFKSNDLLESILARIDVLSSDVNELKLQSQVLQDEVMDIRESTSQFAVYGY